MSGWLLVADRRECTGSEKWEEDTPYVGDCAAKCKGKASMFAFGTNNYGETRCFESGCACFCETSANIDGLCDQTNHNGYRLYKYVSPGNYFCVLLLVVIKYVSYSYFGFIFFVCKICFFSILQGLYGNRWSWVCVQRMCRTQRGGMLGEPQKLRPAKREYVRYV